MAKFSPWLVDADKIKLHDFTTSGIENFIIRTNEINTFLVSGIENSKFFIIGPKGLGKTLLLKLKSLQLREKSFQTLPRTLLCEKLEEINQQFDYGDLRDLETERMWKVIWELCICCWILRSYNHPLPEEISKIIKNANTLSLILRQLLTIGTKNINKIYLKYNNSELRPIINDASELGIGQVALFIDNIDEAFTDHVGESLKKIIINQSKNYLVSKDIWVNAQTAIIKVAKQLMQSNSHLKIFASIRSEAFNQIVNMEKIQISDMCIFLNYNKDQIKQIFIKNIKETEPDRLVYPKESDSIKAFTGFSHIHHSFVKNEKGEFEIEELFDFIYRHTFGRPREIVLMGQEIYNLDPHERTIEKIFELVNKISNKLFEYLELEIIPYFDLEVFKDFCKEVRKNVFNLKTAERAYKTFLEENKLEHICSYYWNIGLLGVVKQSGKEDEQIQVFRPVGQYSLSEDKIPENSYFLLHPATYAVLEEQLFDRNTFFDKSNIVGYNRLFIEPKLPIIKRRIHLHLGMDRDALSVIIPTIYKYKSVAIYLDPTSYSWSKLSESEFFQLFVDNQIYHFRVYRDDFNENKRNKIVSEFFDEQQSTIFYTRNARLINDIVSASNNISFTDYDDVEFFRNKIINNPNSKPKIVSLCKKTTITNKFKNIGSAIKSKFPNWEFRLVLIDRYTYDKDVFKQGEELLICKMKVENFAGIQVSYNHTESSVPSSSSILRPESLKEFDFFVKEFRLLREGLYQYYKHLHKEKIIKNNSLDCIDRLRIFIHLQIEKLLEKIEEETLSSIYGRSDKPYLRGYLLEKCLEHIERLDELYKNRNNDGGQTIMIDNLKNQNIFINDLEFYNCIRTSEYIYKTPSLIVDMIRELHIKPRNSKFEKVFISYSFKDQDFALLLANYLIIYGIQVDIFHLDDPKGKLFSIMEKYVENCDRLIFISSENSLKSPACHFELQKCFDKYRKTWKDIIIPIMIDRYILRVQKHEIPMSYRELFWENINTIKEDNIKDFIKYKDKIDNRNLDQDILNKIVKKYLQK